MVEISYMRKGGAVVGASVGAVLGLGIVTGSLATGCREGANAINCEIGEAVELLTAGVLAVVSTAVGAALGISTNKRVVVYRRPSSGLIDG